MYPGIDAVAEYARQFRSEFAELRYGGSTSSATAKVIRCYSYLRRSEALEAAGLRK